MTQPRVAVYYGRDPPVSALANYDWAIVESAALGDPGALQDAGTEVFAYVSVGEAETWRAAGRELRPEWSVGHNAAWNTTVMDLSRAEWQSFILEERVGPLWRQGYRGLFLDTLDSYRLAAKTPAAIREQQAGLVNIIAAIHAQYPEMKLVVNRGFEVLPRIGHWIDGVVAESLFRSWDPGSRSYKEVTMADRTWLTAQLDRARQDYSLPVIVIDYVDDADKALARETALRIADQGFIPWVSTPTLNIVGIGLP